MLRDQGAYFGKGTKGWFFGFKLHVLSTQTGQIVGAVLLPTSYDDRARARMLTSLMTEGSVCLADLGYRGEDFQLEMYKEEGVLFLTRADIESRKLKILHSTIRERVEGIFSSLWDRFATRVYSRSWDGLWNTLKLKMLDYKLCLANLIPMMAFIKEMLHSGTPWQKRILLCLLDDLTQVFRPASGFETFAFPIDGPKDVEQAFKLKMLQLRPELEVILASDKFNGEWAEDIILWLNENFV